MSRPIVPNGSSKLGHQPIHVKDGKIIVVENEAEQVRLVYRRYLDTGR
jgi:hypothetical protein